MSTRRRPAAGVFSCPNCGLEVTLRKNSATVRRKKSAKKVAAGRKVARTLERDSQGRFLPRGRRGTTRTRTVLEREEPRRTRRRREDV